MKPPTGEIVHEPAQPLRPVKSSRSTVLVGSRASLVAAGHGPRYEAALDPETRRALDAAIAGSWIPIDVAAAHYRACDSLGLSANAVAAMGRATHDRIRGLLYGTFVKVFQEAGGNPWSVFDHWERFWHRGYDGGGLRVTKLGPKDARVDVIACALCESHYFRHALRGLSSGFVEVFCLRAYGTEVTYGSDSVSYRYQWA